MKIRSALIITALLGAASLSGVAPAAASPRAEPVAQVIGKVKINKDGTGTVKARYICSGDGWHLWVSAKQSEDGSLDPNISREGSGFGRVASTWLQSHPIDFTCDGKWHTQKFEINKDEFVPEFGGTIGYGELVPGVAWVQFCLINEAQGLFLVDQEWRKVH